MPDNEIKLDLENCINSSKRKGSEYSTVNIRILKNALDLINRKNAEIEKLREDNETLKTVVAKSFVIRAERKSPLTILKSEAYKECIEKMKEKAMIKYKTIDNDCLYELDNAFLDNVLKELVGDKDA